MKTPLLDSLKKLGIKPSSSELCNCVVRVHVSPLLQECFTSTRLLSDLEFALQSNDMNALQAISQNVRAVRYGEALCRHLSPSDLDSMLQTIDSRMDELKSELSSDGAAADGSAHGGAVPDDTDSTD